MYRIDKVKVQRIMLDRWGTVEQKELAQRANLTEASISRLLAGGGFTAETLSKLCGVLDCTPNDILSFELAPKETALVAAMQ
jgi:DNA-binding Xre family transcriptional regulator